MGRPRGGTAKPQLRLKNAQEYEERLSRISEECRSTGASFRERIQGELSGILGPTVAQAVVYYTGPDRLSDSRLLVEGLANFFHEGADVILQKIVVSEQHLGDE